MRIGTSLHAGSDAPPWRMRNARKRVIPGSGRLATCWFGRSDESRWRRGQRGAPFAPAVKTTAPHPAGGLRVNLRFRLPKFRDLRTRCRVSRTTGSMRSQSIIRVIAGLHGRYPNSRISNLNRTREGCRNNVSGFLTRNAGAMVVSDVSRRFSRVR